MGISVLHHIQIVEYYPYSVVKNQMLVALYTADTYFI